MRLLWREVPEVVELKKTPSPQCAVARSLIGPIADKFFFCGAFCGVVGGAGLGTYLWLSLQGHIAAPFFGELRRAHVLIQAYLFFGLPILGFIFQTAPRVLQLQIMPKPTTLLLIPVVISGSVVCILWPTSPIGFVVLATPFLVAIVYVWQAYRQSSLSFRGQYATWVLISLMGFVFCSALDINQPRSGILFIWSAVVPVMLITGQQFIAAFLGGRRCSTRDHRIVLVLFLLTLVGLLLACVLTQQAIIKFVGVGALCTVLAYGFATRLWLMTPAALRRPLGLSFFFAKLWAVAGAALLVMYGPSSLDRALHMWTIGWVTTLLIAVSCHVIRAMTGNFLLNDAQLRSLLVIWQFVVFDRTLYWMPGLHADAWLFAGLCNALVMIVWTFSLAWTIARFMRRRVCP